MTPDERSAQMNMDGADMKEQLTLAILSLTIDEQIELAKMFNQYSQSGRIESDCLNCSAAG